MKQKAMTIKQQFKKTTWRTYCNNKTRLPVLEGVTVRGPTVCLFHYICRNDAKPWLSHTTPNITPVSTVVAAATAAAGGSSAFSRKKKKLQIPSSPYRSVLDVTGGKWLLGVAPWGSHTTEHRPAPAPQSGGNTPGSFFRLTGPGCGERERPCLAGCPPRERNTASVRKKSCRPLHRYCRRQPPPPLLLLAASW